MHEKNEALRGDIQESLRVWLDNRGEEFCASRRIYGGRNNRAWRIDSDVRSYFLKEYFRHPQDRRDRLSAEFSFLEFCQKCNIGCVALPLMRNDSAGIAIYGYLQGKTLKSPIDAYEVGSASAFIRGLASNSENPLATNLPFAAEACLEPEDHFRLAERRLDCLTKALGGKSDRQNIIGEAANFVQKELVPAWQSVENTARKKIAQADFNLDGNKLLPSPSDFGFHNALETDDGLVFVDFEYAGLDDPLKMLCDFFCQPELTVPLKYMPILLESLETFDKDKILKLFKIFLPLHRLKWCCIILNDFLRTPALRRDFSGAEWGEERLELQLAKARTYAGQFLKRGVWGEDGIY